MLLKTSLFGGDITMTLTKLRMRGIQLDTMLEGILII